MTHMALLPTRRSRVLPLPSAQELEALGQPETAKEVAAKYYRGLVSVRWVLEHHAPDEKRFMGRTAIWYERDSKEFMAKQRAEPAR